MVHIQDGDLDFWIDVYEFPNREAVRPTHGVTLAEAEEACADVGKRLCTAAEWRRACQGPAPGRRFGYAARIIPNICRVGVDSGGHTSLLQGRAPTEAERVGEGTAAAAGSYMDCVTPEGLHDLVGNVEEWVLDDWNGRSGSLEGGAWYTQVRYADCSGRYSRQPDYRLDDGQPVSSAGFRCCRSDAPVGAALRGRDAAAQLGTPEPGPAYDPDAEVELAPGLFMDAFEYPNRPGVSPRTGVSWTEAGAACAEAGKRLCSAAEWERGCAGAAGLTRPYGDTYVPSACGVALDAAPRTGAHLACVSQAGARDLIGSAWEWTGTPLDEPALSPSGATLREVRGGSWISDGDKAVCRPRDGYPAAAAGARHPDLGFRCCRGAAPPPDTPPAAAGACPEGTIPAGEACMDRFEHPNAPGGAPIGGLDFAGAVAGCMERGARLCTEEEWEAACEGSAGRRWPYGDTYARGRCHVAPYGPGDAPAVWPADPDSRCATPEGLIDLSGNLWEWARAADGTGVLRGGGWDLSAGLGSCRARATPTEGEPGPAYGARCCHPRTP